MAKEKARRNEAQKMANEMEMSRSTQAIEKMENSNVGKLKREKKYKDFADLLAESFEKGFKKQ